ncbi:MAG TPA: hypothetical protein VMV45_05720 [Casimicrobiaceae bacterium]|nr:hypothetical protein [Casimicrobiaceae bacterium]
MPTKRRCTQAVDLIRAALGASALRERDGAAPTRGAVSAGAERSASVPFRKCLAQNRIDCQQETAHLASLGAEPREMTRCIVANLADIPDIRCGRFAQRAIFATFARRSAPPLR